MKRDRTATRLGLFLRKQGHDLFAKVPRPVAMGTGLIALDVVLTDRPNSGSRVWAGGTCGNVLAILAYLGWQAYPAATLGDDLAADTVISDLERFGVDIQFLNKSVKRHTPIVVEEIRTKGSVPRHRFVWTCPNCGAWLPGYRALLATEARVLAKAMPIPNIFLFDRVSRGALELAQASAKQGAIVVFEPSGVRDDRLFQEAVDTCHILKYSYERLGHLHDLSYPSPLLEIETLGSEGLRYRAKRGNRSSPSEWREMKAYTVEGLRDAAGAGDWCTAGILHALGTHGAPKFLQATKDEIEEGLSLGQALAAINCSYEGARGVMYDLSRGQLEDALIAIGDGKGWSKIQRDAVDGNRVGFSESICPSCTVTDKDRVPTVNN